MAITRRRSRSPLFGEVPRTPSIPPRPARGARDSETDFPWRRRFRDAEGEGSPSGEIPVIPIPAWKRFSDLFWILLFLPLVLILGIAIYGWIKSVSPGNVLFRQTRIGRGGKPFTIYKFRSMKPDAPTGLHRAHVRRLIRSGKPMTKLDLIGDPRLIRGGCMLRMSGLDELPQLVNVLRGDMSLIGPRPCLPDELDLYDPDQLRRFGLQPGLTGLWQVARCRDTTFREMLRMDEEYLKRLSPSLDLEIIAKTPGALYRQMMTCTRVTSGHSTNRTPRRQSVPMIPPRVFTQPLSASQKLAD